MQEAFDQACRYYDNHYDVVFYLKFQVSEKKVLSDTTPKCCRFCGGTAPEVTFKKVAHAIPEALGNRGLTSTYECDTCNELFGSGIENDLGEWSKPTRTFARLRGKNGIPTLKKGSSGGWRVEGAGRKLEVHSYEDDPFYVIDEVNHRVTFTFKRGAYTPVAVFKAFVKIGLTLMPEEELAPFEHTLEWIRDRDHGQSWVKQAPIIHTFQNGPMPNDQIVAFVLRRKAGVSSVPYSFLILGYGNDVFQVVLPTPTEDASLNGQTFTLVPFPTPGGPDPLKYGRARPMPMDMTGQYVLRGEATQIQIGYETGRRVDQTTLPSSKSDGSLSGGKSADNED